MHQRLRILRPVTLRDELDAAARALAAPRLDSDEPEVSGAAKPSGDAPQMDLEARYADALAVVDAHLACGDFAAVLGLVRTAGAHPVLPIVLARYVRWSGDLQTAAGAWDAIMAVVDGMVSDGTAPDAVSGRTPGGASPDGRAGRQAGRTWLARATAVELAPLATDLGHAQVAARLHGFARRSEERTRPDPADANATTIRRIAFETLGVEPDAVRGRLRLRPRLDRLHELEVQDMRFGDASVRMTASAHAATVEIMVEQEAGAIPITVLLEPYVAGSLPGSLRATVDGLPADLAPQAAEHGTIVPVQLVLDDVRAVVLRSDDG